MAGKRRVFRETVIDPAACDPGFSQFINTLSPKLSGIMLARSELN
jgi:hypothetical protein